MRSEFLRFLKRGLRQGSWTIMQRYLVARKILTLPPLEMRPSNEFAVHTLVCERDAIMAHWAIRSFALHFSGGYQLVIHDDGSCSSTTLKALSHAFPRATVIPREKAFREIAPQLVGFPRLLEKSKNSFATIKWIDFYLLGNTKHIVFLDPDVLFFSGPDEVFDDVDGAVWMGDCFYSLHITLEEGSEHFGGISLPQLNSGLGRIPRSSFDPSLACRVLEIMETALVRQRALERGLPKIDDQPYNAVFSAAGGSCRLLPSSYQVAVEPGLFGVTAKHYTTPGRFWFYEEGIPRVARQLGLSLPRWLRERG